MAKILPFRPKAQKPKPEKPLKVRVQRQGLNLKISAKAPTS